MSPRVRWAMWLTLLAGAGALVLSERGRSPENDIVADVPAKTRAIEPAKSTPSPGETGDASAGTFALRPSTEITATAAPGANGDKPPQAESGDRPPPSASQAREQAAASGPMILALRPRQTSARVANSFAPHDWTPPPPPRPKPAPPPPPAAPPLPYKVLGKKFEDGTWQVFLARQDQIFVVKPQDTLENTYRVEETKPPVMTLTYLPLQQRQTLPIGAAE